eukprot:1152408-Pelagomonas_calceolata.AAC.3
MSANNRGPVHILAAFVVGVVSDFDMLALQAGHSSGDLFPPTGVCVCACSGVLQCGACDWLARSQEDACVHRREVQFQTWFAPKGNASQALPVPVLARCMHAIDETWQAFKTVQVTLQRGTGKKVQEVMTVHPITGHRDGAHASCRPTLPLFHVTCKVITRTSQ